MTHEDLIEDITVFVERTINSFRPGTVILYRGVVYSVAELINLESDIKQPGFDVEEFLCKNPGI